MLTLHRIRTSDQGTFGELFEGAKQIAVTCERPDNGNQKMGCIPTGQYKVIPFNSPSKGDDFLVQSVPNRTMIEIHRGNTIRDTEGCILVGLVFGTLAGQEAVLSSSAALSKLLAAYPNGFILNITEDYA